MLSSRYLHLHEALGLGPMWLNRDAKVLPAQTMQAAAEKAPATSVAQPAAAASVSAPATPQVPSPAAQQARHAAMATVGGHISADKSADIPEQHDKPSEKTAAPAELAAAPLPAVNLETLKQSLAATVQPAEVMVVSICPSPEDSALGKLFSGNVGVLLDNMLAAIGLDASHTHKTSWVKDAPTFSPQPSPEHISAELPRMQAELACTQAKAVLLLGQVFEKTEQAQIIAELCGNIPYVIVPHPARLLRQPQLKAHAWQQLKKLRLLLNS